MRFNTRRTAFTTTRASCERPSRETVALSIARFGSPRRLKISTSSSKLLETPAFRLAAFCDDTMSELEDPLVGGAAINSASLGPERSFVAILCAFAFSRQSSTHAPKLRCDAAAGARGCPETCAYLSLDPSGCISIALGCGELEKESVV